MSRHYSVSDLEAAAARLNALLREDQRVDLTTAEPWWRYLDKQPDAKRLREFGDFLSLHIHPVWDTGMRAGAEAADWSLGRAIEISELSRRDLVVRETGLPGGGTSPRPELGGGGYSRDEQAAFWRRWRGFRRPPRPTPRVFLNVAFEAIDNPTKQSNGFESAWGLLSNPGLLPYPAWAAFEVRTKPHPNAPAYQNFSPNN